MKNSLKKHQIIEKFCEGLNKELANSFLLVGSCGIGKTESVLSSLKNLKLKENQHFKYLNSYSSPLEFYHLLEEVNGLEKPKLLLLDDSEEYINNRRILALLRSSLWGNLENKRIVHWNSPRTENRSFEFKGKIIFLLNELNLKNSLVRALISRGLYYHLELNNQEKIDLMRIKVKEPYKKLSKKERIRIMNYLEGIGKLSDKLNLRSLQMAYNLYILSPNHYKTLIAKTLK